MKKALAVMAVGGMLILGSCSNTDKSFHGTKIVKEVEVVKIDDASVKFAVNQLIEKYGEKNIARIEKGVSQVARLWRSTDGTPEQFQQFCIENFIAEDKQLDMMYNTISTNLETIYGYLNEIRLDVARPVQLEIGEFGKLDLAFSAWDPYAHITSDFFDNKIAFQVLLNFPTYTLQEKTELGTNWNRKQWAYARVGDLFTDRIPAELNQAQTTAMADADAYISSYNIKMGYLRNDKGEQLFPEDMSLITHWNLRDEIKSLYAEKDGLEKQKMVAKVMERIITQEIPEVVINSSDYTWNPFSNEVKKDDKKVEVNPEPNTRYQILLNNFKAIKRVDEFTPVTPTYIERRFSGAMEIPQEDVEKLFVDFISSPVVKDVANIIKERLGRDLQPFDIWYDGFKTRSTLDFDKLNEITKKKYPNTDALQKDLPNILKKLGFSAQRATYLSDKIHVDASRGAGHAAGTAMKGKKSRLRTRFGKDGMDYKGYNIAVHEFGHNVEQTFTTYNVNEYLLNGVPNTAFTEAFAFIFQHRDLELLGIKNNNPDQEMLNTLDQFWAAYEIMGVSVVDMRVWKWLYANPNANAAELKEAVIKIAKDVWNSYYAPVFGINDNPILAIYSHMIEIPLYLSAYPLGHLIEFQIEQYIKDKNLATEMERMCVQGRIIPQMWMKGAVGSEISIEPMIEETKKSVERWNKK